MRGSLSRCGNHDAITQALGRSIFQDESRSRFKCDTRKTRVRGAVVVFERRTTLHRQRSRVAAILSARVVVEIHLS